MKKFYLPITFVVGCVFVFSFIYASKYFFNLGVKHATQNYNIYKTELFQQLKQSHIDRFAACGIVVLENNPLLDRNLASDINSFKNSINNISHIEVSETIDQTYVITFHEFDYKASKFSPIDTVLTADYSMAFWLDKNGKIISLLPELIIP